MGSTLTLLNVRTSVREHIDEPAAGYWTDAELNDYISKAELQLWRKILTIKKDYWLSPSGFTLNTVVNQFKYTSTDGIPSDFWRVTAIRTTTPGYTGVQWISADPNSPGFLEGLRSDVPLSAAFEMLYAVRNMKEIWVSPLPQQVTAQTVDYIQQPTPMSADTDTFLIPDAFLSWVEYMATARALRKGPVGDYQAWLEDAKEEWQEIVNALDTPRSDQGPDVVLGFGEEWG